MPCDVCIPVDIDEYVEEFQSSKVRSVVPQRCLECRQEIPAGAEHVYESYTCAGRGFEHRLCLLCDEIRDAFYCDQGCSIGQLWEDMADYAFDQLTTASDCFRKLTAASKAKVLDRWREWKGLQ